MISDNPLHEAVFTDFYQRSPKKGFNIKAFEALKQQKPIEALYNLLIVLGFAHELVGEKKSIIGFKQDPLSTQFWITGPVACKPYVIYAHCVDQVEEFTVDGRTALVTIAKFIIVKQDELAATRDMSFRPPPKKDDELLCMLIDSSPSTYAYFQETERAIDRDCMLDACASLFRPFGLQPCLDGRRVIFQVNSLKDHYTARDIQGYFDLSVTEALVVKHLQPRSDPLVRIERLDAYFKVLETPPPNTLPYTLTGAWPFESQPYTSSSIKPMILLFLDPWLVSRIDPVKGRFISNILDATTYDSFHATNPDADLSNTLVFNLACPLDRVALVQTVLCIRNQQRIFDDEEEHRYLWHGKQDTNKKGMKNKRMEELLGKLKDLDDLKSAAFKDGTQESGHEPDQRLPVVPPTSSEQYPEDKFLWPPTLYPPISPSTSSSSSSSSKSKRHESAPSKTTKPPDQPPYSQPTIDATIRAAAIADAKHRSNQVVRAAAVAKAKRRVEVVARGMQETSSVQRVEKESGNETDVEDNAKRKGGIRRWWLTGG